MIYCQLLSSNISIFESTCVEYFAITVHSLITSTCTQYLLFFLNIMHKIKLIKRGMHSCLFSNSSTCIPFLHTSLYPKGIVSHPFLGEGEGVTILQFETWGGACNIRVWYNLPFPWGRAQQGEPHSVEQGQSQGA